jgi:hypothetical protein
VGAILYFALPSIVCIDPSLQKNAIHPRIIVAWVYIEKKDRELTMGRKGLFVALSLMIFLPACAYAQGNALSFGYGFGLLNPHQREGRIEGDRPYEFLQVSYSRDVHIVEKLFLVLEPFLAFDRRPNGADVGFNALFRYYVPLFRGHSVFFDLGGGGALTTIDFKEQATPALFMLQTGIGWRWNRFFLEDRFRHYSNGGLASPNHSVHANIIVMGVYF